MAFNILKTYAYGPTAYHTGKTFPKSTALFLCYTVSGTCAGFFPRVGVFSKSEEECNTRAQSGNFFDPPGRLHKRFDTPWGSCMHIVQSRAVA